MYGILTDRAVVEIKGQDSVKFLQNLITNDLEQEGDYLYSYMLSASGRYLFDFFIFKAAGDHLFIDIAAPSSNNFVNKLNFYKLRAKVEVTDVRDLYNVVYIPPSVIASERSERGNPALRADKMDCRVDVPSPRNDALPKNTIDFPAIYQRQDPRFKLLGSRCMALRSNTAEGLQQDLNLYLKDKYEYTIPDGDTDLIYERSFVMEFGGKELHGISYDKGCYVGQEVVSRTEYQGVVRKKIFKITCDEDIGNAKNFDIINDQGEKIGICTSSYLNQGIAQLRIESNINNMQLMLDNKKIAASHPIWNK
jgi:tRNA-modifying protein YgfZ